MRYEDENENDDGVEDENAEQEMSMSSPEREVPIEVALDDAKQENAMDTEAPAPLMNGTATTHAPLSMPLMSGVFFAFLSSLCFGQ